MLHLKQKSSLTPWLWVLFSLLVVLAIVLYFTFKPKPKTTYTTAHPFIGDITQSISATGTLSPTNDITIGTQVSGTIYKIYVDSNDNVKKGQILAEINPNKLNQTLKGFEAQEQNALANLRSAEVALQQRKWTYEQQLKLFKLTNGASPSKLDLETSRLNYLQAQASVNINKANLNQIITNIDAAKIDLQNSIIKSPIDGIILTREVSIGQTVAASFNTPTLFTIAENLKDMKLVVNISESDIGRVQVGQRVDFSVDAYPNQTFSARVDRVDFASTTTDNITSYQTSIFVNNDKLLLRPGMSATANIQIAQAKNATLIPIAAIYYQPKAPATQQKSSSSQIFAPRTPIRPKRSLDANHPITNNEATIYILKNHQATPTRVKIGVQNSQYVQILEPNLDKNTAIITDSQ